MPQQEDRSGSKACLTKRATCHTFPHSFATHLLEAGHNIRTVQKLLGQKDVKTTMVYTHVLNRGIRRSQSHGRTPEPHYELPGHELAK